MDACLVGMTPQTFTQTRLLYLQLQFGFSCGKISTGERIRRPKT
jgi:hypothetical protein